MQAVHFLMMVCLILEAARPIRGPGMKRDRAVLFAVDSQQVLFIEPIVLLNPIEAPPPGLEFNDPAQGRTAEFVKNYFTKGRTYRVLSDGRSAGKVTIDERYDASCSSLASKVIPGFRASPFDRSKAFIATNSATITERVVADRKPTAAEAKAAESLGRKFFEKNKVPLRLLDKMTSDMKIIHIGAGSGPMLATSFVIPGDASFTYPKHTAFMLARKLDRKWNPVIALHDEIGDHDYMKVAEMDLFDHLDLDSDGRDELILRFHQKEGYCYGVMRFDGVSWKKIEGGCLGC